MDDRRRIRVSKYLSRHLRHDPARIGITLDAQGWTPVAALLDAARRHGFPITPDELAEVVATNDKRRYALDGTGDDLRIRASQGHTVEVDLGLPPAEPPAHLFHGTTARHVSAILDEGLRPMGRHHVHLSPDRETATRVGARRGRPVVLTVDSGAMHRDGGTFHLSDNGVWLTDAVPPAYLRVRE
ncbi:RNA 2'-phosphotransferase [Streptomyces avicenniae]|uniref:RNA 2'-phosphotransferase n=1 Tax=Streptomyces avicenniae TaxID=500153 RepID=UPI00069B2A27|nr:RNA 2'-phosphotransferase [Streptomyces avicenniae]